MTDSEKIERLILVMKHVASHTRDPWARDYLLARLEHLGKNPEPRGLAGAASELDHRKS